MNLDIATLGDLYPELDLSKLTEDLASNLRRPADVWREHGITDRASAAAIIATPVFQTMLAEASARWEAPGNIMERIKQRAMMAVEQGLLSIYTGMTSPANPFNHRVEALKTFVKLSGMEGQLAKEAAGAIGGGNVGVQVIFNLGGPEAEVVDIVATQIETVEDAEHADIVGEEDLLVDIPTVKAPPSPNSPPEDDFPEDLADLMPELAAMTDETAKLVAGLDAEDRGDAAHGDENPFGAF